MITINVPSPEGQIQLLQADKIFVDLVNNRITGYGQIPYTVPSKLIVDIIKESARFFYRYYWRATEKRFYKLAKNDILQYIETPGSNGVVTEIGFLVTLPSYVAAVLEVHETNASYGDVSPEFVESARVVNNTTLSGSSILGINNSLYIIESACRIVEQTAMESIFKSGIPFNYTQLTHRLGIHKKAINNLVLETLANVDIQHLYNDDLFIRYVMARVKQELKRLIASHTIQLPGDAILNPDEICNNIEDVEKVEEILRNGSGIGDIIMMR